MNTKYYYIGDNKQTRGPIDASAIQALGEQMKAKGEILSYCKEGSLEWTAYEETFIEEQRLSAGRQMEEAPKEFLQRVRGQTSYATLRFLLKVGLVLTIIFMVLVVCFAILMGGFQNFMGFGGITTLVMLAGAAMKIVAAIVAWYLLTMLIDIADTLIEQNRRKKQ